MTRWYSEKKREHFYKEAKRIGYRARSSFKLLQIQKKFGIIHKGDTVVDLGAAPGGWSQVAKKIVGEEGKVIGIDLSYIEPINGITFLMGDLTIDSTLKKIIKITGENNVDVILSDMSPDISGNYSIDQARSEYLCQQSLKVVNQLLKDKGHFVCKIFTGADSQDFIQETRKKFQKVKCFSPPATRKSSSEIYIISRFFDKSYV
jgi:23S rRNA (uridine2552-2'-O)-methyltransferase